MAEAPKRGWFDRLRDGLAGPAPEPARAEPAPPPPVPAPVEPPSAPVAAPAAGTEDAEAAGGWLGRLRLGLNRTSSNLSRGIGDIFSRPRIDNATLDDLEDLLIQTDLGTALAWRITEAAGEAKVQRGFDARSVRRIVADEVAKTLAPAEKPLVLDGAKRPFVILMVGVNGSGKTTTIGKLASRFRAQGKRVAIAAGDTFRAAAVEQLSVWAERTDALFVKGEMGADAAGLAYEALERARAEGIDVLLIDTAGRLQNRTELMAELAKIVRVLKKVDPEAPHATLLVLDATVGQNAVSQVEVFGKTAGVTGLVMTKLDGTARGGILVALADKFRLPIHFVGVGEGVEDLQVFDAEAFSRALVGLEA